MTDEQLIERSFSDLCLNAAAFSYARCESSASKIWNMSFKIGAFPAIFSPGQTFNEFELKNIFFSFSQLVMKKLI